MSKILASSPQEFEPMWAEMKKADWRRFRNYAIGDRLDIFEFDAPNNRYSGRLLRVKITWIQKGVLLIPDGFCIISFEIIARKIVDSAMLVELAGMGFKDGVSF